MSIGSGNEAQRRYIGSIESAGVEEFASLLRSASGEQIRWLEDYFGEERLSELRTLAVPRRSAPQGNVVVLHGILGAHLALFGAGGAGSTIWISPWSLVKGRFSKLRLNDDGESRYRVQPTGTLKRYYGKPLLHLARQWNVKAFAYDWRLSIRESAERLARAVSDWFPPGEPVHLVAHSMGGLVARAYMKSHPGLWSRGGRLVMLGTPNRGSYAIPQLFAGFHSLLGVLAVIDVRHKKDDLRRIIASFEGAAEMMPFGESDLFEPDCFGAGAPARKLLARVRATQQWVAPAVDPARMIYIAGSGRETAVGVKDRNQLGARHGYEWSRGGDGTVPHELGLLDGVPAYFVPVEHGKLPGDAAVLAAVDEILKTGACTSLPKQPVEVRGGHEDESQPLDQPANPIDQLMASFACVCEPPRRKPRATISVHHGSLESTGAETAALAYYAGSRPAYFHGHPALDSFAGRGALAGDLGVPFYIPGEPPLLLMGLGPVGRLGASELALYVRQLCWTASNLGIRRMATTLTGAGRGNLSLVEAAEIWRRGISESRLEHVAFYEAAGPRCRELANFFAVPVSAARGQGTRHRCEPDQPVSRLSIETTEAGVRAAMLTSEASLPEREIPLDFALVADLNGRLAQSADPFERREWAECLVRLILPQEFRLAFDGPEPMVIVCDARTASLHWEMLRQGSLSRQLKSARAPMLAPPAGSERALVVGDTCLDAPLPHAREEAERLAALLSARGLDVTALLGPGQASRAAVLRELLLRRYDLLHYAGHCRYSAGPDAGWLFTGGEVIGANELQRAGRIPPFVFSNACESGRLPAQPSAAAGFVESFFAMGVQNFICTSWPVGDAEALAFATTVYENAHKPLHAALAAARRAAGAASGAWQHYGNPFHRILFEE